MVETQTFCPALNTGLDNRAEAIVPFASMPVIILAGFTNFLRDPCVQWRAFVRCVVVPKIKAPKKRTYNEHKISDIVWVLARITVDRVILV